GTLASDYAAEEGGKGVVETGEGSTGDAHAVGHHLWPTGPQVGELGELLVAAHRTALQAPSAPAFLQRRVVELPLRLAEGVEAAGCDLAVFPELALTGYPPEDLLLKPGFIADNLEALDKLAARTGRCAAVVGFVDAGRDLYNAAAVCALGSVQGVYHKRLLPNYSVFDEQRYFTPGSGEFQ